MDYGNSEQGLGSSWQIRSLRLVGEHVRVRDLAGDCQERRNTCSPLELATVRLVSAFSMRQVTAERLSRHGVMLPAYGSFVRTRLGNSAMK